MGNRYRPIPTDHVGYLGSGLSAPTVPGASPPRQRKPEAVGIAAYSEHLDYQAAFDRLVDASHQRQRKVRDLAAEVLLTGQIPTPRRQP